MGRSWCSSNLTKFLFVVQLNSNAHVPLAVLHQGVQARRPVANVAKLILVEFPLWIRYQNESNSTEPWLKTLSLKFEWLVPTMVSSMEARSLFLCVCSCLGPWMFWWSSWGIPFHSLPAVLLAEGGGGKQSQQPIGDTTSVNQAIHPQKWLYEK